MCLYLPVLLAQALPEHCPKSLAIGSAVKTFNFLLEYLKLYFLHAHKTAEIQ